VSNYLSFMGQKLVRWIGLFWIVQN